MDRTMKLFLFFCFAVFFFSGCNRKGNEAQVNGPRNSVKAQGKVVPKETAEQIATALAILDEQGKILQEIAPKAAGIKVSDDPPDNPTIAGTEVVAPKNIFQILSALIQVEYTPEGQGQTESVKMQKAQTLLGVASQEVSGLQSGAGARSEKNNSQLRKQSVATCPGDGMPHLTANQKNSKDVKSTVFDLYFNLCRGEKASYRLASWQRDQNGDWQFEFFVKAFNEARIAAYGKLGFSLEAIKSGCAVRYNEKEKHIDQMECRALSTDVKAPNETESLRSLYLGKILYGRQLEVQLKMEGKLYDRSVVPNKELSLVVTDIPKLNTTSVSATFQAETAAPNATEEAAPAAGPDVDPRSAAPGASGEAATKESDASGTRRDSQPAATGVSPGEASKAGENQPSGQSPVPAVERPTGQDPQQLDPQRTEDSETSPQANEPPPEAVT